MTFNEFIEKYKGLQVRDGQCVALFRQYIQDVWELPPLEGLGEDGGAQDLFCRYNELPLTKKYLDLVEYTDRGQYPEPGDVVIFRATQKNKYGHVAIFVQAELNTWLCFEQDGITLRGGAKLANWTTDRVLGWLRKRA